MADWEITSTADFEAGTKSNVETNTDFNDVSTGELHLRKGDIFSDNFEGADGQDLDVYDASWNVVNPAGSLAKISNADKYSGSKSVKFSPPGGVISLNAVKPLGFSGTNELMMYWKVANITNNPNVFEIITKPAGGNHYAKVFMGDPGGVNKYNIYFSNGGIDTNSALTFVVNTWYRIRIIHNVGAGTYDAYILGGVHSPEVQICNNAAYDNAGAGTPTEIQINHDVLNVLNSCNYYMDNLKLGDYEATGNWKSDTITNSDSVPVSQTIINHSNLTVNNYIDKIEWLIGGVTKATYATNITAGASTTIEETDLTSGTLADVDSNFQVKIYLVSNGTDTPKIELINGSFLTPPAALNLQYIDDNQVDLTWSSTIGETSLEIERKESDGSWIDLVSPGTDVVTYDDISVVVNSKYEYRVRTLIGTSTSIWRTSSAIYTTPASPDVVNGKFGNSVTLVWNDNSPYEEGFEIQRKTYGTETWTDIVTTVADVTTYIDTTAEENIRYIYRVRSFRTNPDILYSDWLETLVTEGELIIKITDVQGNILFVFPSKVDVKVSENAATEVTLTFDNPEGLKTNILHYNDDIEIDGNL